MRHAAVILLQITLLLLVNQTAHAVVAALELPVPGNLLGMLILLALLVSGLLPLRYIEAGASLLTRHLAFFFIPITVGLMAFADVFLANGPAILVILVLSAAAGICVAGLSAQRLAARRRGSTP